MKNHVLSLGFLTLGLLHFGCAKPATTETATDKVADPATTPVFSLSWSEYPSWSVFGVAAENGLIDGAKGKQGSIEKKYGIDIVLLQGDYDTTITQYNANTADAVCITNMDALAPSLRRKSVAIMPTSTSDGADGVVTTGSGKVPFASLKGKKVFGLEKSVSEYLVHRLIEKNGLQDGDITFATMDPAAAAQAFGTNQNGIEAIVVWNPFLLQTLENRKDSVVVGDSTSIPMEIIDMVVVAQESLVKPGGPEFAKAICETYYTFNTLLDSPTDGDKLLVALGEKFSHLSLNSMRTVVKQTKFFKTAADGIAVFKGESFPGVMGRVATFCTERKIVDVTPKIAIMGVPGNDPSTANLVFTTEYMNAVKKTK